MATITAPKRILVNNKPIRLRWLQQIIWSFLMANAGALAISALYYIFVQLNWHYGSFEIMYLKPSWDHLFSFSGWAADRHDVRNVYEGVLATLFVKSMLANWKKGGWEAPWWYVALSPLIILVAAAVPVALGVYLLNHGFPYLWHEAFSRHVVTNPIHLSHTLSWLATYLSGYPWQPTVIGILAGLVVHRVYAPAGNTIQMHFVGRAVDRTRDAVAAGEENPYRHLPRWPLPPVIRERAAWVMEQDLPVPDRTRSMKAAVYTVAPLFAFLVAYGAYIRYVVAKGH